jgi:hypothetical protein
MTTNNAPAPRVVPVHAWTGKYLIVWGGEGSSPLCHDTGGLYDPEKDRWIPMSQQSQPTGRRLLFGGWTGTELIVWGGTDNANAWPNTGGRFTP